ncbi:hypothetical protein M1116_02520 [Patescibacteria group bacterium]|nr:hypothetical protein [Patescibacteria group bacterium]
MTMELKKGTVLWCRNGNGSVKVDGRCTAFSLTNYQILRAENDHLVWQASQRPPVAPDAYETICLEQDDVTGKVLHWTSKYVYDIAVAPLLSQNK